MRRLIILFLLLPVWVQGGCQSKQQEPDSQTLVAITRPPAKPSPKKNTFPRNYSNASAMNAFYSRLEGHGGENVEIQKASDFISSPLLPAPDPSVGQYLRLIKSPFSVMKDTITNLHNARYIDTLFQLTFDSSTVELYYPMYTKQVLLSYADIKSSSLALRNGIQVGTSREELLQKLQDYKLFIKEQKNVVEVCDWERNSWLRFHLSKGLVSSIQYEGYLD